MFDFNMFDCNILEQVNDFPICHLYGMNDATHMMDLQPCRGSRQPAASVRVLIDFQNVPRYIDHITLVLKLLLQSSSVAFLHDENKQGRRMEDLRRKLEMRKRQLQEEVVTKSAILYGLPPVEVVELQDPFVRFVRLRNPKQEGLSLKKKQCDLWEFCWGSGALLAHVMANSIDFSNKRTIELGGGIGLATLALCSLFQTQLSVMTDLVPDALNVFKLSMSIQPNTRSVEPRVLNWNKPEEGCEENYYDIVMGSDVLFMSWCAPAVAKVAHRCLSRDGIVLIVDPYRLNDKAFLTAMDTLGITHQETFEFPSALIERLVVPVLDSHGSVVPVKRAKLLVASRVPVPSSLIDSLQIKAGLILNT